MQKMSQRVNSVLECNIMQQAIKKREIEERKADLLQQQRLKEEEEEEEEKLMNEFNKKVEGKKILKEQIDEREAARKKEQADLEEYRK